MVDRLKIYLPYLTQGFTTSGLSSNPEVPDTGLYNIFLNNSQELCLQDDADNVTVLSGGGGGSVPVATSGAGGGTIGKLTVDSNFGFTITTGVLTFKLATTGGLEFDSGDLQIKLDGTTLATSASGTKVNAGGIYDSEVNSSAAIGRSKLASGTNNGIVRNNSSGVMTDSTNLTFSEGASDNKLIVKANAAQTQNIHEWQNSAGSVLSYVDNLGNILVPAAPATGDMLTNKTYVDSLIGAAAIIGSGTLGSNADNFVLTLSENIPVGGTVIVTIDAELSANVTPDWFLIDNAGTNGNFIYRFYGGAHSATGVNPRVARLSASGTSGQRMNIVGFLKITEDSKLNWGGQYWNGLLTHYGQAVFYQSTSTTSPFSSLKLTTNQTAGTNAIGAGTTMVVAKLWI